MLCGKKILGIGVIHCADRIQGLCKMVRPLTAADLEQFLCMSFYEMKMNLDPLNLDLK
ncbi:unnamed protein product [Albugo candida]|uniref:Uncharacterized protein n=1 Tax=Albugo candida TaxID=65357 RepID=A0A024GKI9_9STRA|nr:unnamed protein product [Albugo candida]|eukprot:CCI47283.1 unnamed protein product [Albugo candida]